ncbi:MAG: hypothetical protein ACRENG_29035 [bacterium]
MYNIYASSSFMGLELLGFLSVSQAGLPLAFVLWQIMFSNSGLQPCSRLAHTLSVLVLEHFNVHHWVTRVSRLGLPPSCRRNALPPILSSKFLLRRDGQHIFDFFKTLSLNDVSPPVLL